MLVACRRRLLRNGFREAKSPMPTFRPDIFAQKRSKSGKVMREIAVEAEIPSTLFYEHTTEQLLTMEDYIQHQRARRIRVDGYLLVPHTKAALALARSLITSLFARGTSIRVLGLP